MARRALDEFHPDFCVIWGDDHLKTYRERLRSGIFRPGLTMQREFQPWLHNQRGVNSWNEPKG